MKHLTYILLAFALLLSSCKTCVPVVETIEKERIVEVHTRDTAIITQADSASVRALFKCDSAYNVIMWELVTMQGDRIETNVHTQQTANGLLLSMDCHEDSLVNEIQLRDSVIHDFEKHTKVVQVEVVPNYYKNTSIGFWILLAILLVIVGFKVYKLYIKIQSGCLL